MIVTVAMKGFEYLPVSSSKNWSGSKTDYYDKTNQSGVHVLAVISKLDYYPW